MAIDAIEVVRKLRRVNTRCLFIHGMDGQEPTLMCGGVFSVQVSGVSSSAIGNPGILRDFDPQFASTRAA